MAIDRSRNRMQSSPLKQNFIERIRLGNVTPIISGEVMADLVLGGQQKIVADYANYIEYPLDDRTDLLKMTKFKSIHEEWDDWELKSDYLNFIKQYLYERGQDARLPEDVLATVAAEADNLTTTTYAARLGYPNFADGQPDPLLILANLPLPIYLTTCHHGFLEAALKWAGKEPQTDFVRWHTGLDGVSSGIAQDYEPSVQKPLVYHLYGLDSRPNSLVLTEDDHLKYLVAVAQGKGLATDPIDGSVRQALTSSALMMLGFGLPGWAFRVLFWGLIEPAPRTSKGIFSLQLEPSEIERKYLQDYLKHEAKFDIFWGDIHAYTSELQRLWGNG